MYFKNLSDTNTNATNLKATQRPPCNVVCKNPVDSRMDNNSRQSETRLALRVPPLTFYIASDWLVRNFSDKGLRSVFNDQWTEAY